KEQIDRVWDQVTGHMELEEEKVKDLTREHFDQQNRIRKDKYKLIESISKEELKEVIKGIANGKTAGASAISYEMLKNCGEKEQD
ncbi:11014_t:CDS:2, partial [Acaulospora morrowiae]